MRSRLCPLAISLVLTAPACAITTHKSPAATATTASAVPPTSEYVCPEGTQMHAGRCVARTDAAPPCDEANATEPCDPVDGGGGERADTGSSPGESGADPAARAPSGAPIARPVAVGRDPRPGSGGTQPGARGGVPVPGARPTPAPGTTPPPPAPLPPTGPSAGKTQPGSAAAQPASAPAPGKPQPGSAPAPGTTQPGSAPGPGKTQPGKGTGAPAPPSEPTAPGASSPGKGLTPAQMAPVVMMNGPAARDACWGDAVADYGKAPPAAHLVIQGVIAPSGEVSSVHVAGAEKDYPKLGPCLESRMKAWKFPKAEAPTNIKVPFTLNP